jgi:hypothetical protein
MKKVFAVLMCLYWMGLMLQPVVAQILPSSKVHKSCCADKKANKGGGCQDNKDKSSDCCPKGKCNPLFSQCPMCAYVAVPPAAQFSVSPAILFTDKVIYGIAQQTALSSFHSCLFRPPIVLVV